MRAAYTLDEERRMILVSNLTYFTPELYATTAIHLCNVFGWESAALHNFMNDKGKKTSINVQVAVTERSIERRVHSVAADATFLCQGRHSLFTTEAPIDTYNACALSADACYLYVTGRNSVHMFDASSGAYRRSFGSSMNGGEFIRPCGIYASDAGELYVCESGIGNQRVHVLNAFTGTFVRELKLDSSSFILPFPISVVVSRQLVYVCDWSRNQVFVFNESNGTYLHSFGFRGTNDGQFTHCVDVAASSITGHIYVLDGEVNGRRVQVFDQHGQFQRVIYRQKRGDMIGQVRRICISATDVVYLSDYNCYIHAIDPSDKHISTFNTSSSMVRPLNITCTRDGRLFVLNDYTYTDRLDVFE